MKLKTITKNLNLFIKKPLLYVLYSLNHVFACDVVVNLSNFLSFNTVCRRWSRFASISERRCKGNAFFSFCQYQTVIFYKKSQVSWPKSTKLCAHTITECNFFAFKVIQLTKPAFKKFNNGTVYDKQLKNGPLLGVFSVKKAQFIRWIALRDEK